MAFSRKALRARGQQREAARTGKTALSEEPYYQGDTAGALGAAIHTNPHPPGTENHMEWARGWLDSIKPRSR